MTQPTPSEIAQALLACPPDGREQWAEQHRAWLSLAVIEELKQQGDQQLTAAPQLAEAASACALLVAQHCPDEPLALPLAFWARGNVEAYRTPQAAIQCYETALAGYRAAGHAFGTARLLGNLVFPYSDCGRWADAEAAYREARALLLPLSADGQLSADAQFCLLRYDQNYGWLLHNRGDYPVALDLYADTIALAQRLGQPLIAAEVRVNRAVTLGVLGRLHESEQELLAARAVAESHGQALTVARTELNLGWLYTAQGQPSHALRRFHAARDGFSQLANWMEVGTTLLLEAALLERLGAVREASESYEQSYAHFVALDMAPLVGTALVRGAAAHRMRARFDGAGHLRRAAQLLDQADQLWRSQHHVLWCATVLLERVELALAHGDAAQAEALLTQPFPCDEQPSLVAQRNLFVATLHARTPGAQALARDGYAQVAAYARESGDRWMLRQALAGLGRLLCEAEPVAACQALEEAAGLDELIRQALTVEELKASFHAQANDLLPLLARISIAQGRAADALSYVWRAKGGPLIDLLCGLGEQGGLNDAEQRELAALRQALAAHRLQLTQGAPVDLPEHQLERSDGELRRLEQQISQLRRKRQRGTVSGGEHQATPARLFARCDADVLIEYVRCGEELLALRVDRGEGCQAFPLTSIDRLLDLLDSLQLAFQYVVTQPRERCMAHSQRWLGECRSLFAQLYAMLIAPLGPLPAEARLLIAPCAPLTLLPFAALWDGQSYLVERHELLMTPCGALVAASPPLPAAGGMPLIIAASAEGRLGAARLEAAAVASALASSASRCLVDDPASLRHLTDLRDAPRFLHLSAHSLLREDAPIFSALRLPDGLLTVEQCYELALTGCELVTLSACTSAAGLESGGALLAFQTALFVAGAQHVLASLWPIADAATVDWMQQFYGRLAAGLSPGAALRATQRALLDDPAYCHPAFWAAFACSRR